jgi:hypothetical protein
MPGFARASVRTLRCGERGGPLAGRHPRRSRTQEKITAAPGCATARNGCAAGRSAGVSRVAAASGACAAVYSKLAMI